MPIYKTNQKNKEGLQKYKVRVNYVDTQGKPRQKTRVAYGLKEAKALEESLRKGGTVSATTINDLFELYEKKQKYDVRVTSYTKTIQRIRIHILPTLGSVKLEKLSTVILESWKQSISAKGLMLSTRKGIYAELRAMLNYGVKLNLLSENPLLKVGNFKDSNEIKREMDFYTPGEFKLFMAEAKSHAESILFYDYYVFFAIALFTGMRKGEIHALRWVDIRNGVIRIRRNISQKIKGVQYAESMPKNSSSIRDIKIPQPLDDILNDHHDKASKMYKDFSEDMFICGGLHPLSDTQISNENIRYSKMAGIKTIRIHDFRHTHVSFLINNDVNILEISRRLGHSTVEQTLNTYAHLYPINEDNAISVLDTVHV